MNNMESNVFFVIMEVLQSAHKHIPKYTDQCLYHLWQFSCCKYKDKQKCSLPVCRYL